MMCDCDAMMHLPMNDIELVEVVGVAVAGLAVRGKVEPQPVDDKEHGALECWRDTPLAYTLSAVCKYIACRKESVRDAG